MVGAELLSFSEMSFIENRIKSKLGGNPQFTEKRNQKQGIREAKGALPRLNPKGDEGQVSKVPNAVGMEEGSQTLQGHSSQGLVHSLGITLRSLG